MSDMKIGDVIPPVAPMDAIPDFHLDATLCGEMSCEQCNYRTYRMAIELTRLRAEVERLSAEKERLKAALRQLSCLGSGDRPGNSIGNQIAQDALAANGGCEMGHPKEWDHRAAHAEKLAEALDALIGAVQLGEKLGENEFAERMENAKAVLAAYRKGQG